MNNEEQYNLLNALEASTMNTPFSEINALGVIQQPTHPSWIKTREVQGRQLSYVSGDLVIRMLNKAFRNRWSFEIKETRVVESIDKQFKDRQTGKISNIPQNPVVQVLGRLTVPGWGIREQWGAQPLSGGNDVQEHAFKAAGTDALKKCASMFGVTLDLYGQIGSVDLMITPEDFLREDDKYFEKLKEKLIASSQQKISPAEPDLIEEETPAEIPSQSVEEKLSEAVQDLTQEQPKVEQAVQPVVEQPKVQPVTQAVASNPVETTKVEWKVEDIEEIRTIKSQLGLTQNTEFDKYVQQFMNSSEATMLKHITPTNLRDFITFLKHNYLNNQ